MSRPRAGYIGFNRVPSSLAASGVWTLQEVEVSKRAGTWPLLGDPLFSSVRLLLHMDGTGSSFVDSSPSPKTVTANGNATQSTTQSKFGGKSAAFDGNGDYLSIADNAALEIANSDFAVELWLRTTQTTQFATIVSKNNPGFFSGSWTLLLNVSQVGDIAVYAANFSTESPLLLTSGINVADGAWHHVAWVRSGTQHSLYVDGTRYATATSSFTFANISSPFVIGNDIQFPDRDFSGFIDELRYTLGNNRGYTGSTITVPTAAFPEAVPGTDPLFSSVALLLKMEGTGATFADSSSVPKTITAFGNATQSTAQSKFGAKSGLFDGSGDYLTAGSIPLSTSDFVIEGWFYLTSLPASGTFTTLFAHRANDSAVGGALLVMDGASMLYFIAGPESWQHEGPEIETGLSVSANTWMHIALVRSGNQCRAYLNGTGGNAVSVSGEIPTGGSFSLMAGAANGVQTAAGYCDEFRITVGSDRGYTGSTITVPATAFPTSA